VQFVVRAPLPYSASDRLRDQFDPDRPHPRAPSKQNWLGTEGNGADVLSRMIHACRIAMAIGFIATGIAVVIGSVVGGLMGYFVGWVDLLGMRLVEIFGSIPTIYFLLVFVAFFDRNLYMMMVIIGLTTWVGDARFVRAEFLKLRNQEFVHAARAAGLPLRSILFRHMLPNAMAPLLVAASFGVASAILYESVLSFLGLGLVDEPSWGQLLNQAVSAAGKFDWWLATFPGLAIFLTVFAYNLIGEALRDALDPKLRGIQ
jgi:peptide/nickel transport system permease protein